MVTSGGSAVEVLLAALRLGLTSFGGPIAHIGYFRREYVERRRWLDETTFAELAALCQSLPGPASSQLGVAIGTIRAGWRGGIAAWLGFTLPSAVLLAAFALLADPVAVAAAPWAHGLRLAAVAVVAQAVWTMRRSLTPDAVRLAMAAVALGVALLSPSPLTSLAIIAGGAVLGPVLIRRPLPAPPAAEVAAKAVGHRAGLAAFATYLALLAALPLLRATVDLAPLTLADPFYRAGALVFGGGHVVLPLLQDSIVARGWLGEDRFLAGYGAAQAVPGPLFTFAGYLGAAVNVPPGGVIGAAIAVVAIFLPGILLIWAALPFWGVARRSAVLRHALAGVGAAVVGLLAAALYDPVWTGSVAGPVDAAVAAAALLALVAGRVPPILVVAGCAIAAQVLGLR